MYLSPYISDKESNLLIYNNRLYSCDRIYYSIIYLYDYFKTKKKYNFDITVRIAEEILDISYENHSLEYKQNLYKEFKSTVLYLKDDLDFETVCKIHIYLLHTLYQNTYKPIDKEKILAKEKLYKNNIMEAYSKVFDCLSNTLYTKVGKGYTTITVNFTLSVENITNSYFEKIDINLPNSDGVIRSSLDTYIPFLLRDELKDYDDSIGKELVENMLEKQLKEKFPHLSIIKMRNYTFEISIGDPNSMIL